MKIVFLDADTLKDLPEQLARIGELGDFTRYNNTAPDETIDRLAGADVAISNKVYIGKEELDALPDLKLICIAATGKNNIDLAEAEKRNIPVRNVSGYSTDSVAQLTMTALFTLAMDLIHLNGAAYDGTYLKSPSFSYWRRPFYELGGARYGIIGLGTIGHRVAKLATAYGAEVVYYSTSGKNTDQPYPSVSLEELLETCEVISIHCPLNEATKHLIDYEAMKKMKASAYLINMGRGGIVHEADLVKALDSKQIAGAAVDVFTTEPFPSDHVYQTVADKSKLLLTPHIGWASVEARTKLVDGIVENIREGW